MNVHAAGRGARRALAIIGVSTGIAVLSPATPAHAGGFRAAERRPAGDSAAARAARSLTRPAPRHAAAEDSLLGRSGKLRARLIGGARAAFAIPLFQRLFGVDTLRLRPGVYSARAGAASPGFNFIALRPFEDKNGGWLGSYHIGFWPGEKGRPLRSEAYANPDGFIEVTAENENTPLSEHFRLRDFTTHDQHDVWPKYLVVREELVDKLELVIAQLEKQGIKVKHLAIMSGFRTPEYNVHGGETGGRAGLSRHMYGDAADVFVDNDYNGRMDDLNHDHRVDWRDAQIILRAVEQVERRYPELVGGVGLYRGTRSHGPFAHVDVRGERARWRRVG